MRQFYCREIELRNLNKRSEPNHQVYSDISMSLHDYKMVISVFPS